MKSRPTVSVIIVNTNQLHRLEKCLPSLYSTLPDNDIEIIVSDNGSTDGSIDYLKKHYPSVAVAHDKSNQGHSTACNRGARLAKGDVLVFLDPDTVVEPNWLNQLLEGFKNDRVGLVTSKLLLMSEPTQINTCGNSVHLSGLAFCIGMREPRDTDNEPHYVDAVSGASFAISRQLFEHLGGFDDDFFVYVNETELSLRARLAGWNCWFAPQSVVHHDYALRIGPKKVYFQERNRYMMFLKVFKIPTLILLLPTLLLAEIVTWGFVITADVKNWKNKLLAYWWILTHIDMVRSKRRMTQRLRRVKDREVLQQTSPDIPFTQVTSGLMGTFAALIFNPLFRLFRVITLALVKW